MNCKCRKSIVTFSTKYSGAFFFRKVIVNSTKSVIFNAFGFDGPVTHKLFHFLNRQADVLHGRDDVALYSILAGLVLFSPDKSSRGIEILQSYQDELYDLLHAYCERYRSIDKSLVTKVSLKRVT